MITEKVDGKRAVTYENIKYGMLVEVLNDGGYHSGCKVHFFNTKGVLVGNYYEFLPYSRLRLRAPYTKEEAMRYKKAGASRDYQRFFYRKSNERIKNWLFVIVLNITSSLIRFTQKHLD